MSDLKVIRVENAAHHLHAVIDTLQARYAEEGYEVQSFDTGESGTESMALQVTAQGGLRAAAGLNLAATATVTASDSDLKCNVGSLFGLTNLLRPEQERCSLHQRSSRQW